MAEELETGPLPDITIENLQDFLSNIGDSLPDMINKAIAEVFEFLTPQRSGLKTNQKQEIGERVILSGCVDSWGVSFHYRPHIQAIDNIFHLLDGKGISKHPFNLPTLLEQWDHRAEKYVRIGEGSPGTYTFYKTKDLSKKGKNIRVRHTTTFPGVHTKAWFQDREKAEARLILDAKKMGGEN